MSDGRLVAVVRYVRYGSESGGTTTRTKRFIAFIIWWKTWALLGILSAGILIAGYGNPGLPAGFWGFVVGLNAMRAVDMLTGGG